MFCPRCGMDNPPVAKFCNECGFALQEIHTLLQQSKGSQETLDTKVTSADGTSMPQEVLGKKIDPKKQYIRSTTMLPADIGESPRQQSVQIQPVPEPGNVKNPIPVQRSLSLPSQMVPESPPVTTSAGIRNPTLAVALSLIPGLGQVYNGNLVRGIIFFIATLIGLVILIIPGIIVWIYSIYDAYRTAGRINRGEIPFNPQET
jgi:TM2 domain-containing membrane protein YozV